MGQIKNIKLHIVTDIKFAQNIQHGRRGRNGGTSERDELDGRKSCFYF